MRVDYVVYRAALYINELCVTIGIKIKIHIRSIARERAALIKIYEPDARVENPFTAMLVFLGLSMRYIYIRGEYIDLRKIVFAQRFHFFIAHIYDVLKII